MNYAAIVLYDGVEPIDIGATFGVLSMATRRIPDLKFFGVAERKGAIKCAGNLVVQADYDFATCPEAKNVIVTGGPGWVAAARNSTILNFIRSRSLSQTTRLTSICTGSMILAAAGLLCSKSAATKHEVFAGETAPAELLAEMSVQVETNALVETDGVLTSGGVCLGVDAIFHLLAKDHGQDISDDVARVMEYSRALSANREALGYRLSDPA